MVDVSAIAGAVSALKGATDIAKAMIDLRDGQMIQAKVIELNRVILEAQSSLFAANEERATLIERISQLEKQLAKTSAWDTTKERYESVDVGGGVVAYTQKPTVRGTEAPHYACANCYHNDKLSLLNQVHAGGSTHILSCPACKATNLIQRGYRPPGAGRTS